MPETAVDEDREALSRKNEVGVAEQLLPRTIRGKLSAPPRDMIRPQQLRQRNLGVLVALAAFAGSCKNE
ncbi:MAG: hypothetical protein ABSD58_01810 [Verrucomicrobiia bacterium]|jgi:hypothetical protein